MADKFGLRAWTINLRTWIFGFACLVFKTTCIDRGKPLREGAFFFTGTALFPPLDERNTRNKAKGLRVASERHIGELGVTRSSPRGACRSAPPSPARSPEKHGFAWGNQ